MITRDEVVEVLALAAAFDQRKAGPADVTAWTLVAQGQRWAFEPAKRAVVEHYSTDASRPRITPAAISDRLRALRNRAAAAFDLPAFPPEILEADGRTQTAWFRAAKDAYVREALEQWATSGVEPDDTPQIDATAGLTLPELISRAPERVRPQLTGRRVKDIPQA